MYKTSAIQMTELGKFLARRSVNKSDLSRKTGITQNRINNLTLNEGTHLRGDELYLISLALQIDVREVIQQVYKDVRLVE